MLSLSTPPQVIPRFESSGARERSSRPRTSGITHVLDKGLSLAEISGLLEVAGHYVDIVKLGWGTALVVNNLAAKLNLYHALGTPLCCGGSLFEYAALRGRVEDYVAFLEHHGITLVEVSDGVAPIPLRDKLGHIERLAKSFRVLSEVGSKDEATVWDPEHWSQAVRAELDAGAWKVVLEGRESGSVGMYGSSGQVRSDVVEHIAESVDPTRLIFEAPRKSQQVWLVKRFGLNVNLGNIAPSEVISVETIRQGLRADTLLR
jgi:phosphosulfolactate synthase